VADVTSHQAHRPGDSHLGIAGYELWSEVMKRPRRNRGGRWDPSVPGGGAMVLGLIVRMEERLARLVARPGRETVEHPAQGPRPTAPVSAEDARESQSPVPGLRWRRPGTAGPGRGREWRSPRRFDRAARPRVCCNLRQRLECGRRVAPRQGSELGMPCGPSAGIEGVWPGRMRPRSSRAAPTEPELLGIHLRLPLTEPAPARGRAYDAPCQ
jgi:hypothetical protein